MYLFTLLIQIQHTKHMTLCLENHIVCVSGVHRTKFSMQLGKDRVQHAKILSGAMAVSQGFYYYDKR